MFLFVPFLPYYWSLLFVHSSTLFNIFMFSGIYLNVNYFEVRNILIFLF